MQSASCRAGASARTQLPSAGGGLQWRVQRQQRSAGVCCAAAVRENPQLSTLQLERAFQPQDTPQHRADSSATQTSADTANSSEAAIHGSRPPAQLERPFRQHDAPQPRTGSNAKQTSTDVADGSKAAGDGSRPPAQLERPFRQHDAPQPRVGSSATQTSTDAADASKSAAHSIRPLAPARSERLRGEAPGNAAPPDAGAAAEAQASQQSFVMKLAQALAKLPRHASSAEVLNGVQLAMPEICRWADIYPSSSHSCFELCRGRCAEAARCCRIADPAAALQIL